MIPQDFTNDLLEKGATINDVMNLYKMYEVQTPQIDKQRLLNRIIYTLGISRNDFLGYNRKRFIADARFCYMYILRTEYKEKLKEIGKQFGRDHSTIIHAIRTVEALIKAKDLQFCSTFIQIKKLTEND